MNYQQDYRQYTPLETRHAQNQCPVSGESTPCPPQATTSPCLGIPAVISIRNIEYQGVVTYFCILGENECYSHSQYFAFSSGPMLPLTPKEEASVQAQVSTVLREYISKEKSAAVGRPRSHSLIEVKDEESIIPYRPRSNSI